MNEYHVGDKVILKSYGPSMVVKDEIRGGKDTILCLWFDYQGNIHEYNFPFDCIKREE